ncbi:MAG TPA: hypothetical protein VN709_06600 [Terriglobales bacterium]|nr:hypothetical protein [Terriglobales bacterium]
MRRAAVVLALAASLTLPLGLNASQPFNDVVREIGAALHSQPLHPHLLGMVSFMGRVAHPHGVSGFHLALFSAPRALDLETTVGPVLDPSWHRMVKSTECESGQQSLIYVRPDGHNLDMLIVALNDDNDRQVAVITMNIRPDQLVGELDHHRNKTPLANF